MSYLSPILQMKKSSWDSLNNLLTFVAPVIGRVEYKHKIKPPAISLMRKDLIFHDY